MFYSRPEDFNSVTGTYSDGEAKVPGIHSDGEAKVPDTYSDGEAKIHSTLSENSTGAFHAKKKKLSAVFLVSSKDFWVLKDQTSNVPEKSQKILHHVSLLQATRASRSLSVLRPSCNFLKSHFKLSGSHHGKETRTKW